MTNSSRFTILGSGIAGLGAANLLHERGVRPTIYEARHRPGGLTTSHDTPDGYNFDEGVHISFTNNERVKDLFAKGTDGQFETGKVYCNNYWKGHWIKHPAQVNLHGLPTDLVVKCIQDFVIASANPEPVINNYEDWLLAAFGETFARTFPAVYTVKYHTTEAKNLTTDWLGPRLYRPKLDEVLHGALSSEPLDVFYVNDFRYPTHGGYETFLKHFFPMADIACDHQVSIIDMAAKELTFANGKRVSFENLISSIPLPKLLPLIKGAPRDVLAAAELLAWSQALVVNIGINRPIDLKPQWSYFYDEDIPFARVSHRTNLSPTTAPAGHAAFQAEIYFSDKYRPFTGSTETWIELAIDGLIKAGLVQSRDEVVHRSSMFLPFGNIIFDHDRPKAIETVHGYLNDINIAYCGRFGDWGYIWTDQAFLSGERAAKVSLDRAEGRVVVPT
ncbi:MAG: protoporphyrinogen/coproporphyrinogen oxidase [Caulobacterales bacterium]